MKDIYELLNYIDIDEIEYIEMETNDIEKQKYKRNFKNAIKGKNKRYKKAIAIASLVVILGFNETAWASVENVWVTLKSVLELKSDEITNYKYEINKSVESKNIKVNYKNLMIDDNNLIVEIDIDDSKFDAFKDFTKEQQKDWNVDKWGDREKLISVGNIEAYVDGQNLSITHPGQADFETKSNNSNSITSVVSIIPLNEMESISEIDSNKIYNIKLDIKRIHMVAERLDNENVSYAGAINSDWSVEVPIKGEDLIKSTVNYDTYEIGKDIKINIDGVDKYININTLKLSPIHTKLNFTTDLDTDSIEDQYDIGIKIENGKGQEYQLQNITPTYNEEKNICNVEVQYRNIFRDNKMIKLTPVVTNIETDEKIEQESINLDLDNYNQ